MKIDCPITFVNSVAVSGFANGVANLAFSTAGFVPKMEMDGKVVVDLDERITANLRMDLFCLQQLHDLIGKIIKEQVKPPTESSH